MSGPFRKSNEQQPVNGIMPGGPGHRVTGQCPSNTLACDWCKQTTKTTLEEVWCLADTKGWLVRLCGHCGMMCAG